MSKTPMQVYNEAYHAAPAGSDRHDLAMNAVAAYFHREALEEVAEWSRQVRITIRGIDGQAKRRVHVSHFNGVTEEIIDGYELGTGLWHRLLGLLSSCPISEGTNASPGSGTLGASDAALLPGLREALKWKPNTPQLENAMTYAWESALKSFIRAIESAHSNASPGSGGQPSGRSDSQESPAAGRCREEAPSTAGGQGGVAQPGTIGASSDLAPPATTNAAPQAQRAETRRTAYDITALSDDAEADAEGVARFADAMTEKLARKRGQGRGGWNRPDEFDVEYLRDLLAEHVGKGDMVDIANLAMMIWNRLNPSPAAAAPSGPSEDGATPETDAVIVGGTIGQLALLEHARTLERRLSAVTKERDALMSMAMRERTQP